MSKNSKAIDILTRWEVEKRNGYHAIDEYSYDGKRCISTIMTHLTKNEATGIASVHNYNSESIYNALTD